MEDKKGLGLAVWLHAVGIALDPAVGKVDPEHGGIAAHGAGCVQAGGDELGIDDPVSVRRVTVCKCENIVDKRGQPGCVGTGVTAGVFTGEQDQGIQFLDGGQPPVVITGQ